MAKLSMRAAMESAYQIGMNDFSKEKFSMEDMRHGMEVERDHTGTKLAVVDDLDGVAKIALTHLRERPDYYRLLDKVEKAPLTKSVSLYIDLIKSALIPSQKKEWTADKKTLNLTKVKVKQHWRHLPTGKVVMVQEYWTTVPKGSDIPSVKVHEHVVDLPENAQVLPWENVPRHNQTTSNLVHFTVPNMPEKHAGYMVRPDGSLGYLTTPEEHQRKVDLKFNRAAKMADNIQSIRSRAHELMTHLVGSLENAVGTIISLIDEHVFRIGGDESRKSKDHYGITTLEKRHVIDNHDGTIMLQFVGKSGHNWMKQVEGAEAKTILKLVSRLKNPTDMVWNYHNGDQWTRVTPDDVRAFTKEWGLYIKDFRTYHASRLGFLNLHEVAKDFTPKVKKKYKDGLTPERDARDQIVTEAIRRTAEFMNHKVAACRSAYICPEIYTDYLETGVLPSSSRFNKSVAGYWLPGEQEFVDWILSRRAQLGGLKKSLATFEFYPGGAIDITF